MPTYDEEHLSYAVAAKGMEKGSVAEKVEEVAQEERLREYYAKYRETEKRAEQIFQEYRDVLRKLDIMLSHEEGWIDVKNVDAQASSSDDKTAFVVVRDTVTYDEVSGSEIDRKKLFHPLDVVEGTKLHEFFKLVSPKTDLAHGVCRCSVFDEQPLSKFLERIIDEGLFIPDLFDAIQDVGGSINGGRGFDAGKLALLADDDSITRIEIKPMNEVKV